MDSLLLFLLLVTVGSLAARRFTETPLLPGQAVTVIASVHTAGMVEFQSCYGRRCNVIRVDGRSEDKQNLAYVVNWDCNYYGGDCSPLIYTRRVGGFAFSNEELVFHVERDAENLIVWEEGKPQGKAWIHTLENCTTLRVGNGIPVEISGLFGAHGPRSSRNYSDTGAPFTDARLRDMVADVLQGLLPSLRVTLNPSASALKSKDNKVPDPVGELEANATASSALVRWRPSQQVRGELEYFEVRAVRVDQGNGTANATARPLLFFETPTADKQQQSSYEKLITDLQPGAIYNVTVRCRDSVGLNEPAFLSFTTLLPPSEISGPPEGSL